MPSRLPVEDIKRGCATLKELAKQAGRDPDSIEVLAFGQSGEFRDPKVIRDLEASGVKRLTVWLPHPEGDEALAEMEEIAQQVLI